MSKEKEIQDELERYWGQLDRVEKMLKWLVVRSLKLEPPFTVGDTAHVKQYYDALPDISDILEEKDGQGR